MTTAGPTGAGERIKIESQIVLPWSRTFQMTKESILVRFGRSVITALGIFLGIAFLSAVLFGAAASQVQQEVTKAQQGLILTEDTQGQARVIWLVAMSLLVATVGIVNSMLTAVTERYKEIGTMKCLGALDRFIVRLFILESALVGVLGSIAGAIVGTGIMSIKYTIAMGWRNTLSSWTQEALTVGGAPVPLWLGLALGIAVGGVLSVLAALYPAWRAAKMPPAAALRSEF